MLRARDRSSRNSLRPVMAGHSSAAMARPRRTNVSKLWYLGAPMIGDGFICQRQVEDTKAKEAELAGPPGRQRRYALWFTPSGNHGDTMVLPSHTPRDRNYRGRRDARGSNHGGVHPSGHHG